MEVHFQFLLCGYNGTGYSSLVSIEKAIRNEVKIFNRFLINVGDGTQRFCSENKIKLFTVSTIIITSLSPQNISGFPGVFLALSDLGVGEIVVYGPPGLNSILNLMLPFINRKHPILKVIEIEVHKKERIKGGLLELVPICAAESQRVLALAVSFHPIDDFSFTFEEENLKPKLIYLPISTYFETSPKLEDCLDFLQKDSLPSSIFIFSPLTADSQPVVQDQSTLLCDEFQSWKKSNSVFTDRILQLSQKYSSLFFFHMSTIHSDLCEFKFTQWGIYKLRHFANALFPKVMDMHDQSCPSLDHETQWHSFLTRLNEDRLIYSIPLLKIIFGKNLSFDAPGVWKLENGVVLLEHEKDQSRQPQLAHQSPRIPFQTQINLLANFKKINFHEFDAKLQKFESFQLIHEDDGESQTMTSLIQRASSEEYGDEEEEEDDEEDEAEDEEVKRRRNEAKSLEEEGNGEVLEEGEEEEEESPRAAVSIAASSLDNRTPNSTVSNHDVAAQLKASLKRKLSATNRQNSISSTNDMSILTIEVTPRFLADSADRTRERANSFLTLNTDSTFMNDQQSESMSSGPSTLESNFTSGPNSNRSVNNFHQDFGVESPLKVMRITPKFDSFSPTGAKSTMTTSFFPPVPLFFDSRMKSNSIHQKSIAEPDDDDFEEEGRNALQAVHEQHQQVLPENELQQLPKSLNDLPLGLSAEMLTSPMVVENYRKVKELLEQLKTQIIPPNPFHDLFQVTFLGTGCATPSKYRNSSAIMLRLFGEQVNGDDSSSSSLLRDDPIMLLDCGEGTTSQIFQSVNGNLERFDNILNNIRVIWISHHHGDHATGIPLLIHFIRKSRLRKARKEQQEQRKREEQEEQERRAREEEEACLELTTAATGDGIGEDSFSLSSNPFAKNKSSSSTSSSLASKRKLNFLKKNLMLNVSSTPSHYEENKILLLATDKILKYYEELLKLSNLQELVTFCPITNTLYAGMTTDIDKATNGIVKRIQSIPVIHCQNSFGLVMEFHRKKDAIDGLTSDGLIENPFGCAVDDDVASFDSSSFNPFASDESRGRGRRGSKRSAGNPFLSGPFDESQEIPTMSSSPSMSTASTHPAQNSSSKRREHVCLVYSGDCRPSQSLIRAGQSCDLLIHEATFSQEKAEDALKKKHSTIDEAISTAIKMNAKHLILTHFSQRYPVHRMAMQSHHQQQQQALSGQLTVQKFSPRPDQQPPSHLSPLLRPPPPSYPPPPQQSVPSPFGGIPRGPLSSGRRSRPSSLSAQANADLLQSALVEAERIESYGRSSTSFAYDLLKVSFPSQIDSLPFISRALSEVLEEIEGGHQHRNAPRTGHGPLLSPPPVPQIVLQR